MKKLRILGVLFIVVLFIGLSIHVFNYFGVGNLESVLDNYDFKDGIFQLFLLNKDSRDKFVVSSENETKSTNTTIREEIDTINNDTANNDINRDDIIPFRQFPFRQNVPSPFFSPEYSKSLEDKRKYNDIIIIRHTYPYVQPTPNFEEYLEKERSKMEKEAIDEMRKKEEEWGKKADEFYRKRIEELKKRQK